MIVVKIILLVLLYLVGRALAGDKDKKEGLIVMTAAFTSAIIISTINSFLGNSELFTVALPFIYLEIIIGLVGAYRVLK